VKIPDHHGEKAMAENYLFNVISLKISQIAILRGIVR
jgi:hypothetical protein